MEHILSLAEPFSRQEWLLPGVTVLRRSIVAQGPRLDCPIDLLGIGQVEHIEPQGDQHPQPTMFRPQIVIDRIGVPDTWATSRHGHCDTFAAQRNNPEVP